MDKFYKDDDGYIYIETANVEEASKIITDKFEKSSCNEIKLFLTKIILPNISIVVIYSLFEVLVDKFSLEGDK